MSQIRRRQIGGKAGGSDSVEILYPDYFSYDFETTEDNSTINLGNYMRSDLADVILDDTDVTISTITNGTSSHVSVSTAGTHTIRVKINNVTGSHIFRCYPKSALYIPYNAGNITGRINIDPRGDCIIYSLSETPPGIHSSSFGTGYTVLKLYVPVGCSDAYKAASVWSRFSSVIEERDFNYTIPNE